LVIDLNQIADLNLTPSFKKREKSQSPFGLLIFLGFYFLFNFVQAMYIVLS